MLQVLILTSVSIARTRNILLFPTLQNATYLQAVATVCIPPVWSYRVLECPNYGRKTGVISNHHYHNTIYTIKVTTQFYSHSCLESVHIFLRLLRSSRRFMTKEYHHLLVNEIPLREEEQFVLDKMCSSAGSVVSFRQKTCRRQQSG